MKVSTFYSKILVRLGTRGDSVLVTEDKDLDSISVREVKGCKSGNLREMSVSD